MITGANGAFVQISGSAEAAELANLAILAIMFNGYSKQPEFDMAQKIPLKKKQLQRPLQSKRGESRPPESPSSLNAFGSAITSVAAATAKNSFASILDDVNRGRDVIITKYNTPKAVVISFEKFNSLTNAATPNLSALTAEFNARLARMQTKEVRGAMQRAFEASPDELGRAALRAQRSR